MKFMVDLVWVRATEMVKGSCSLQTVLIWLLETLFSRRTTKNGNCATVIDFVVVQKEVMKKVKDINVIPEEECFSQYRLLIMDLMMEHRAVRKLKNSGKVKLWRLKDEKIKRKMKDAKEEPESWDDWSKHIMNVAKRACGLSKSGHNQETTRWWNEKVKEVIKEKRRLYKVCQKKKDQQAK